MNEWHLHRSRSTCRAQPPDNAPWRPNVKLRALCQAELRGPMYSDAGHADLIFRRDAA
jgi:hypothetical protein